MNKRVVSGIQPTGSLHLGNYLGAIRNWVRMQDEVAAEGGECLFFIADLHAITVRVDAATLTASTRAITAALLAAGIDPERAILFNQARVPAHSQLAWLLNCTARLGWLNRMTQFKEKSGKDREGASIGLYAYPVLQAADVLLYQATHVPVGDDQKQHLELARDIATKFNTDTGVELFRLPEPIPDDPAALEARPEARNLIAIYGALANETPAQVVARFAGQGFGQFKPVLADILVAELDPIAHRLREFAADPARIDGMLEDGAARARSLAEPTLAAAHQALGLCAW
jgi:tryptophanyl-tRNA synthetase